eukprot:Lithocolla_globosa_v1_NODE_2094_length_2172_cov_203.718942.p2 type:complete len:136 gc:universal NODE_2094_length_2172_cov_203.718942:258-665(+)
MKKTILSFFQLSFLSFHPSTSFHLLSFPFLRPKKKSSDSSSSASFQDGPSVLTYLPLLKSQDFSHPASLLKKQQEEVRRRQRSKKKQEKQEEARRGMRRNVLFKKLYRILATIVGFWGKSRAQSKNHVHGFKRKT